MLFTLGRVCIKLAGRDAGKYCVIVEEMENGKVLIDGQTRRRACNVHHLEPMKQTVDIAKGADSAAVAKALATIDISVPQKGASRTPAKKQVKRAKA